MANDNQLQIDIVIDPSKAKAQMVTAMGEITRTAEDIFAKSAARQSASMGDSFVQASNRTIINARQMMEKELSLREKLATDSTARLNNILSGFGIKNPQQIAQGISGIKDALAILESQGIKSGVVVDQLNTKMKLLETGNARGRGELHKFTAALASMTFEMTGAVYGITALASVIAAPAFFGTAMLKRIEDAQTGITGILMSMGTLDGKALTFGQAWQASAQYVKQVQADSMKYGIDMGRLMEVNQAAMSGGLNAMMNLEQIQKVATAGAIAVSSLGLNSQQYVQEVRDLISGGIQPASSTLARSIGVTDALLKQWKAQGPEKLVQELTDRLQGFMVVADEVRTKTLTGSWDILQARLSMLLSDEAGFGAIKKAVIDVANWIGKVDISGKFIINPDAVAMAQAYWDSLKSIGSVLVDLVSAFSMLSPILKAIAQVISLVELSFQMLVETVVIGVKSLHAFSQACVGNFEPLQKLGVSVDDYWQKMDKLGVKTRELTKNLFDVSDSTKKVAEDAAKNTVDWTKITGKAADEAIKNFNDYANKHKTAAKKHHDETLEADKLFYEAQLKAATSFSTKMVQLQSIAEMKRKLIASDTRTQAEKDVLLAGLSAKEKALASQAQSPQLTDIRKTHDEIKITEEKVSAYQKLIEKINESAKATSMEAQQQEKLSTADKLVLEVENYLLTTTEKLSVKKKEALVIQLSKAVVSANERDAILEQIKAQEKLAKSDAESLLDDSKKLDSILLKNSEIGKSVEITAELEAQQYLTNASTLELEASNLLAAKSYDLMNEAEKLHIEQLLRRAGIQKQTADAVIAGGEAKAKLAAIEAEKKAQKELWTMIDGFAHKAFDNIFDKGQNVFKEIGNAIKKYLLDMLYKMTIQKWLIPVGITGGMGVSGAAQAGDMGVSGAAQAGGMLSGAAQAGGMLSSVIGGGGFLGELAGGISGAMSGGIIEGFQAGMSMIGLEGGFASGLGLMLPGIGAALTGISLLGGLIGNSGTPGTNVGAASTTFSPTGAITGQASWAGLSPATNQSGVQAFVNTMNASYRTAAQSLGVTAASTIFSLSQNLGKDSNAPQFAIRGGVAGGSEFFSGWTGQSDAAMQLAASRAIFTALQGSDLPAYLKNVFKGLDASKMSQTDIDNALQYAQSLKKIRDGLTETRSAAEILTATINAGTTELGTSAATFTTDFVAAIDAGLSPENLQKWLDLGNAITQSSANAAAAAEKTRGLEIQLLELSGRTAEATALRRQQELSTLSETDKALQLRIYALQDEAAAVAAANAVSSQRFALEAEYANLTGDNTLSRIAELQALDPSNRALKLRIWALQDEQAKANNVANSTQNVSAAYQNAAKAQADYLKGLVDSGKSIRDFLQGLKTGINENTTISSRFSASRSQYIADLTGARAGNLDAYGRIVQSAQSYIEAGRAGGSTSSLQQRALIAQITAEMSALPAVTKLDENLATLKRIESAVNSSAVATTTVNQSVVDVKLAITETNLKLLDSLSENFNTLDVNSSKTLTFEEFKTGMEGKASDTAIQALFNLTDTNHDGLISQLESNNVSIGNLITITEDAAASAATSETLINAWGTAYNSNPKILSTNEMLQFIRENTYFVTPQSLSISDAIYHLGTVYLSDIRSSLLGTLTVTSKNQDAASPMYKFATGGAFTNGVVSYPTAFNIGIMGEAGAEAIMPLTNINGKLGVSSSNSSKETNDLLKLLLAENAEMKRELSAIRATNYRMWQLEDKWDIDGTPEVRTVA